MVALGDRVDRGRAGAASSSRRAAAGASSRPTRRAAPSGAPRAAPRCAAAGAPRPSGAAVGALAVDRHRRGDDELARLRSRRATMLLEQHGGAERVHRHVALDLVHRLADADGRGLVEHHLDAVERARARAARSRTSPTHELGLARADGRAARSAPCTCGSRLSSTRTRGRAASSASTRCEPMKPAPPVTRTFTLRSSRPAAARRRSRAGGEGALGLRGHQLGGDARHAAVVDRTIAQVAGPARDVGREHAHALEVERVFSSVVGPITSTTGTPSATATCRAPASFATSSARAAQTLQRAEAECAEVEAEARIAAAHSRAARARRACR